MTRIPSVEESTRAFPRATDHAYDAMRDALAEHRLAEADPYPPPDSDVPDWAWWLT